jgi:predicted transcriptional regulator
MSPIDEVDDFIVDHVNYFPELEDAAEDVRRRLDPASPQSGQALAEVLARDHGVGLVFQADQAAHQTGYRYDEETRRLLLFERMPEPSVRFQMARLLARLTLSDVLHRTVDDPRLTSDEARRRAVQAMESYVAGAVIFPYEAFHASALQFRYDVELLIQRFGGSFEQVCHRLVTLRRPGAEGVPFAFLRVDPAGNISKRFSLPGLRLPKYRESCAHWAVFQALGTPDRIVAQRAALPTGAEFLMVARSVTKQAAAFGAPRTRFGVMIACEAVYRDQIVYGDGFIGDAPSLSTPVGVTCRLCSRTNCQQRAHPAIV